MKRIVMGMFVGLSLMTSGCTIELGGLKEVARSIDGMRAQLDKTTTEGGDLDRLLEKARKDVDGLIEKAIAEGGKLEEKVVLDFIKQRKEVFADATALMRKTNLAFRGSAFAVTDDMMGAMRKLPAELSSEIGPLVLAIPGLFLSTDPVQIKGSEITFRPKGYYRLTIDARQAANLEVRVDHKAVVSPRNPMDTRVDIEIPASSLLPRFRDQEREFVTIELVDRKNPNIIRFIGSLDLKPLFGVEYELTEFGPKGQEKKGVIDQGAALEEILGAVGVAMKVAGADPVKIAERHGMIYEMAKTRLPYGSSFVDLPPGFDDFEMTITLENGAKRTLDANRPRFGGVSTHLREKTGPDNTTFLRLTIDADPPTER